MEPTITQSGALYFVQHKGMVPDTPLRRDPVLRVWNFRSLPRRIPRIRLPRTALYHHDLDKWGNVATEPDEQISSRAHKRLKNGA